MLNELSALEAVYNDFKVKTDKREEKLRLLEMYSYLSYHPDILKEYKGDKDNFMDKIVKPFLTISMKPVEVSVEASKEGMRIFREYADSYKKNNEEKEEEYSNYGCENGS